MNDEEKLKIINMYDTMSKEKLIEENIALRDAKEKLITTNLIFEKRLDICQKFLLIDIKKCFEETKSTTLMDKFIMLEKIVKIYLKAIDELKETGA